MKCKTCGRSWTFAQAVRRSLKITGKKECPYCGSEHYSTKQSHYRFGVLAFSALFVFMLLVELFQMRLTSALFFAFFILLMVTIVHPLMIHLTDAD
ncbi:TIGR04104 family putative zinc finger protein [Halobacillus karajensis]|uniref:Cxxc_20_cxxc protein n=1 Tax=Halobacillus karajensis TaxID=195088 RepID=A0A024P669_9BACI|nr:TIGR04104 family putative zinc finger protein [Halobacillus karajensis]CDQ17847.1 cxxc_20_cxxc protein [Halobacillus karajensis]CDQ24253.1 cxxc_20_cxxc protein [Halobacillus karajensis]CDQ29498.1 cxxc_20_cxxc protein [Halobacillus karajensis]